MRQSAAGVRLTLRKADKLVYKAQFDRMKIAGVKTAGPGMVVVKAAADQFQCAVICGKKYSLLAVKRNRARRLIWESLRQLKPQISPCHLLVIPRRRLMDYSAPRATEELLTLLRKLDMIIPSPGARD